MEHYGLVGRRLGHSFSRSYFTEKFRRLDIDAVYSNYELADISGLPALLAATPGLRGFNVTIPYKQAIMPMLHTVDPAAASIGAVNTVRVHPDGTLSGHNTDAPAFGEALRRMLEGRIWPEKALVLGTGGAACAVAHALRAAGMEVQPVSRVRREGILDYAGLTPEIIGTHRLIVNTTPLGMWPDTDTTPPLPFHLLTPAHSCFDLVYNPEPTLLLRMAAARGAAVCSGALMLRLQAEGAWRIWNGEKPDSIEYSKIAI